MISLFGQESEQCMSAVGLDVYVQIRVCIICVVEKRDSCRTRYESAGEMLCLHQSVMAKMIKIGRKYATMSCEHVYRVPLHWQFVG